MHIANPDEGISWNDLRKKLKKSMAFDLIVKPIVWFDLNEAIEWYEKESPCLGKRFFKSLKKRKKI